jgi:hypothetical protein
MKKYIIILFLLPVSLKVFAQANHNNIGVETEESIVRDGLNLDFTDNSENFSPIVKNG